MSLTISIITATYNSASTIRDTLDSVASQKGVTIEHIIVDGKSTDNTLDVVRKYKHVATLISEPDKGIYDAMNKGVNLATGDVIAILNSDDFYQNNFVLSTVMTVFEDFGVDSCYGDLQYVDQNNTSKIVRTWKAGAFNRKKFLTGWMPPHPSFFVKKEVYQRYGLFDLRLKSSADYELMLRFLYRHRISTHYIPKVLVKMRAGGQSNASLLNRIKANKEDQLAWKINSLKPWPFTTWLKPIRKIGQFHFKR